MRQGTLRKVVSSWMPPESVLGAFAIRDLRSEPGSGRDRGFRPGSGRTLTLAAGCVEAPLDPVERLEPGEAGLAAKAKDTGAMEEPGPYAVGYRVEDVWVERRPLRLHYWYPAAGSAGPRAVYRPRLYGVEIAPGEVDPVRFQMEAAGAVEGAEIAGGQRYSVIVLSAGWGGTGFTYTDVAEQLASRGFFAVALDHNGSSLDDELADVVNARVGRTVVECLDGEAPPCTDGIITGYIGRARDVTFALDLLEDAARGMAGRFFDGHVRSQRGFGVMGLSAGANTALLMASGFPAIGVQADPRVQAIPPLGIIAGMDPSRLPYVTVPALFSAGTADLVAPPATTAWYFNGIASSPRLMVELSGAAHQAYQTWCPVFQSAGAIALESPTAIAEAYIAESYVALTENRPFRSALSRGEALGTLLGRRGGVVQQPDPVRAGECPG